MLDLIRAGSCRRGEGAAAVVSVIVVGLNHRTVPVELLERMAVPPARLPKALHDLGAARAPRRGRAALHVQPHRGLRALHAVPPGGAGRPRLPRRAVVGRDPDDFADHLYTYHDDAAVAHLFGVAAGLDSMIIGEGEILGQVREAWQRRRAARAPAGQLLVAHVPPRGRGRASGPAPRPRSAATRCRSSSAAVAVAAAADSVSLDGRRVLVLGAGEMGEGMALALAGAGVGEIVVANRTHGTRRRARAHASAGARSRSTRSPTRCVDVDVLLASTGATEVLVERERHRSGDASAATGARCSSSTSPCPATSTPASREVLGVTLLDIDDLKALRASSRSSSGAGRSARCARSSPRSSTATGPSARRARSRRSSRRCAQRGERLRAAELERFRAKLDGLDPEPRDAVEALTRGIVNKLLHEPTVRLKDAAGTARGELYADALGGALRPADGRPATPTDANDPAPAAGRDARQRARPVAGGRGSSRCLGGDAELVVVSTRGDQRPTSPIHAIGGTGVFVKEVQQAVLDGRADLAVHSAKDLPADDARRPRARRGPRARRSARRARRLARSTTCRTGARVGTGSVRRRAQLAALRPDLTFGELRGNIPTRLEQARRASTPSSWRPPRSTGSGSRDRVDRARSTPSVDAAAGRPGRARGRVPGRRRRHARARSPRSTTSRAHAAVARRARVPRRARRRVQPPVRRARADRRPTARSCSRRCSRRSTGTSCCGCSASGDRPGGARARGRPPTCSTSAAAARCSTLDGPSGASA